MGTVHHFMHHVADVMQPFSHAFVYPKANKSLKVHNSLHEHAPNFDGCMGAIDRTHIPVIVDESVSALYTNRYGQTTMNICAMVYMRGRFTFVAVGMAGSSHD